jgi:hypothetical protein
MEALLDVSAIITASRRLDAAVAIRPAEPK